MKRARIKARTSEEFNRWVRLAEKRATTRMPSKGLGGHGGGVPLPDPTEALSGALSNVSETSEQKRWGKSSAKNIPLVSWGSVIQH